MLPPLARTDPAEPRGRPARSEGSEDALIQNVRDATDLGSPVSTDTANAHGFNRQEPQGLDELPQLEVQFRTCSGSEL